MAKTNVAPTDFTVRSFIYRTLAQDGARFKALGDTAIASDFGCSEDEEVAQAKRMGIADLSPLPRVGFKGREAIAWVRSQGVEVADGNNQAATQKDGSLVARLADTEVVVLSDAAAGSDIAARLEQAWEQAKPPRCFLVPRRHSSAWFRVTGEHSSEMFAKICGVDMRLEKFPNGSIAQTSMARMNAIGIRDDIGATPEFHLVFDSASADYLWSCLKDAIAEFEGAPVGHAALLGI